MLPSVSGPVSEIPVKGRWLNAQTVRFTAIKKGCFLGGVPLIFLSCVSPQFVRDALHNFDSGHHN